MTQASAGSSGGLGFGLKFELFDAFSSPAQNIQASFGRLSQGADKMSNNIQNSIGRMMAGAAQMGAAREIMQPFFTAIKAFAKFDSLERGLTTIMGSVQAAKDEMIKLREVAKLPGLGFAEAVSGSVQLQSVEMSANMARDALLGYGNAIGLIGGSKVDLDGVVLQLRQMMSVGKVLGADLRPIMSRIPQLGKIMQKIWGTSSAEGLSKLGISAKVFVEKTTAELLKLPKASAGLAVAFENLSDTLFLTLKSIGKPLAPFVMEVSDFLGKLGDKVEAFSDTAFGGFVIKLLAGVAAISAIRLGLAAFQSWLPEVIKKTGLFSPVISGITAVVGGLFKAMTGGFLSVGKSLFTFASANFGTIAMVAAFVAIQQLMKGYDSFMGLVEGKQGVLTGFNGFLQKMGGYAKAVWEILSSVSDKGFSLSEDTFAALQKLGIADTVLNIGTWIIRLQQVWYGFTDTMKATWNVLGNVFDWIGEKLNAVGIGLDANLDPLEKWRTYGRILGVVVVAALAGIALGFVFAGISAVAAGIATLVAWFPVIAMVIAIVAAIALIGLAFYGLYLLGQWAINGLIDYWKDLWNTISTVAKKAWEIGVNFIKNLLDGIKSVWDNLVKWISDAWKGVTDIFSLDSNVNVNSTTSTSLEPGSITPYSSGENFNDIMDRRAYVQNAPRPVYNTNTGAPVIIDKSTVKQVTLVTQVDGRDVRKSLFNLDELDGGR